MTTRDDELPDGLDIADDPTGMRALLASLPDPGPMPPDVMLAISQALAAEDQPLAEVVPLSLAAARPSIPRVLPLGRYFGAAAASVALIGLGFLGLTDSGQSMVSALVGGSSAQSAAGGSASALTESDGYVSGQPKTALTGTDGTMNEKLSSLPSGNVRPALTPAHAASVQVYLGSSAYTTKNLVSQATQFARDPGTAIGPLAAESPAVGPIGTPLGIEACAAAAKIPTADVLLADLATFDGKPAVVIVAVRGTSQTAYVAPRTCGGSAAAPSAPGSSTAAASSTDDPSALLAGPVALPAVGTP